MNLLYNLTSPVLFKGDEIIAYRDPAVHFHRGVFYLYFTFHRREGDGHYYVYTAMSRSGDLLTWERARILTPKDLNLNFSSPGNVIRYNGRWLMCLQTYPTPGDEAFGTKDSRIWTMGSDDLVVWDEPELMRVKGDDVPREQMGRMIDPYLFRDKDVPGRWWCFYKQNGVSMSYSDDLATWTYHGRTDSGENACVLIEGDEYVLFHSPKNGVGIMRSSNLEEWRQEALITLGQSEWPWAQGRLTAGTVIDLRAEKNIGKYVMFFHGSTVEGLKRHGAHGAASLGIAWGDNLVDWEWPGSG